MENNILFEATVAHFKAQEAKAKAILSVYFSNPVAIGEHPDLIAEIVKYTEMLADAQGALETLENTFKSKEGGSDA